MEKIRNEPEIEQVITEVEEVASPAPARVEPVPLPADASLEKSSSVAEEIIDTVNQRVDEAMSNIGAVEESTEEENTVDLTPGEPEVPLPLNVDNTQEESVQRENRVDDSSVTDVDRGIQSLNLRVDKFRNRAFCDDGRSALEYLNERAIAEGFETWQYL